MAKEINGRFYLDGTDELEADMVELTYNEIKNDYEFKELRDDADVKVWVEDDDMHYEVKYAYDIPKSDPHYGTPYFVK